MPTKCQRAVFMLAHIKCKPGQPHAVEHAFKQGRHCRPPERIDDNEMLTPLNRFLQGNEVGLERLYHFVPLVEYRIEFHLAHIKTPDLVPRFFGCCLLDESEFAGERRSRIWVAEQHYNFFRLVVAEKSHLVV